MYISVIFVEEHSAHFCTQVSGIHRCTYVYCHVELDVHVFLQNGQVKVTCVQARLHEKNDVWHQFRYN